GFTSRDRRFPTPQPTTTKVLLPQSPGTLGALLPISQPNSDFRAGKRGDKDRRGGGGLPDATGENCLTDKVAWNFLSKWPRYRFCVPKKFPLQPQPSKRSDATSSFAGRQPLDPTS